MFINIRILEGVARILAYLGSVGFIIFGLAIILSLPCYIGEEICKFLERKLKKWEENK